MAKAKLKKKSKTKMVSRNPEEIINEMEVLKQRKKDLDSRLKSLKGDLTVIIEGEGTKDSKGSFNLIVGNKKAQKQARKSVKLDAEKAEEFFKSIGIWDEVIETKEIINEDYVEQALLNEKFTMEDLEAITNVKTTYAIVVNDYTPDEEEDMPEIDVR